MAETELTGIIRLTADTTEAEKKVGALDNKTSAAVSGEASKHIAEIATKLREIFQNLGNLTGGVAGAVARSIDDVITHAASSMGGKDGIGGKIGESIKKTLRAVIESGMPTMPKAGEMIGAFQRPSFAPGSGGIPSPTGLAGILNALGVLPRAQAMVGIATAGGGAGAAGVAGGAAAAGGAAGGAAGIAAGLGPVGIALGIAAAEGGIVLALGAALKEVTSRVLDFGRSLADASPSMAMLFAQFDLQIMMMKRQIGEMLAPAFAQLLPQITDLANQLLPLFVGALEDVIAVLSKVMGDLQKLTVGAKLYHGITEGVENIAVGNAFGGINEIKDSIKQWFDWQKNQAAGQPMPPHAGMIDYMKALNQKDGPQMQYQKLQQAKAALALGGKAPLFDLGARQPGMGN